MALTSSLIIAPSDKRISIALHISKTTTKRPRLPPSWLAIFMPAFAGLFVVRGSLGGTS